jgi:hypothetical protein
MLMKFVKMAATAALLAGGATLVMAQASPPNVSGQPNSPSKVQPGAPDQGPAKQDSGTGTRPIGPPADPAAPAPGNNPTGVTKEKQKSDMDDPRSGGTKK